MAWKLFDKDGNQVKVGDELADFREKLWVVKAAFPPGSSGGMSGRVQVKPADGKGMDGLFYPQVLKCKFVEVDIPHGDAPAESADPLDAPKTSPRFNRAMAEEKGYDE